MTTTDAPPLPAGITKVASGLLRHRSPSTGGGRRAMATRTASTQLGTPPATCEGGGGGGLDCGAMIQIVTFLVTVAMT